MAAIENMLFRFALVLSVAAVVLLASQELRGLNGFFQGAHGGYYLELDGERMRGPRAGS